MSKIWAFKYGLMGILAAMIVFSGSVKQVEAFQTELRVGVASNFKPTLEKIIPLFEKKFPNYKVIPIYNSTGSLYVQIINGSPYDILLAADDRHSDLLIEHSAAISGTNFIYAKGRVVIVGEDAETITSWDGLSQYLDGFEAGDKVTLANPLIAPYGMATKKALKARGLWDKITPTMSFGMSVMQTYQFIALGNAKIGFVSASMQETAAEQGLTVSPLKLDTVINQEAILLEHAYNKEEAVKFLEFLQSPKIVALIRENGYE